MRESHRNFNTLTKYLPNNEKTMRWFYMLLVTGHSCGDNEYTVTWDEEKQHCIMYKQTTRKHFKKFLKGQNFKYRTFVQAAHLPSHVFNPLCC